MANWPCGENIFLNLAAECSLILDYSINKIFRDVNNVSFISNVTGRKSMKFIIAMDWFVSK